MSAGYRIGRDAPDFRIGSERLEAIYLGSSRLYPSSLTFEFQLARGTFSYAGWPVAMKVGLAAIVLDTRAFSIATPAVNLRASRRVDATPNVAYTLAGQALSIIKTSTLPLEMQPYTLYGQDMQMPSGLYLQAEQGLFALAVTDVAMEPERWLYADQGSFATATSAAGLIKVSILDAAPQTDFAVSGSDIGLTKTIQFPLDTGMFAMVGEDADFIKASILSASPQAAFALTGAATGLPVARRLSASPQAAFALTGAATGLYAGRKLVLGQDTIWRWSPDATLTYVSVPSVLDSATTTIQGTTVSLNLPTSAVAGDKLFLFVTGASTGGARSFTTPSGWTEVYNIVGAGALRRGACYYKVAAGGESSVSFTVSALTNLAAVAIVVASASDWEAATPSTGTTNPNPPNLSPVGGSGKLWFAAEHAIGGTAGAPTYPSGMTGIAAAYFATGTVKAAVAGLTSTLSSYDPNAFTDASSQSIAGTVSVR